MGFTPGTRVKVINEKLAQEVSAYVKNGDKGTFHVMQDGYAYVRMDSSKYMFDYLLPSASIQRIHCKKVKVG